MNYDKKSYFVYFLFFAFPIIILSSSHFARFFGLAIIIKSFLTGFQLLWLIVHLYVQAYPTSFIRNEAIKHTALKSIEKRHQIYIDDPIGVKFVKRVQSQGLERGTNVQSSPQRSLLGHSNVRKQFYGAFKNLEGGGAKGVLHVEVEGNPHSEHQFPSTVIHEAKRGGTIVSSFIRKPENHKDHITTNNPERQQSPDVSLKLSSNSNPKQKIYAAPYTHGKEKAPLCVIIGKCNNSNQPKSDIIGYENVQKDYSGIKLQNNLKIANAKGYEYRTSSSQTFTDSPNSIRELPTVKIQPGKESGHLFSMYVTPNSPNSRSIGNPQISLGGAHQSHSIQIPNLIGQINTKQSSISHGGGHQHQNIGKKRSREEHAGFSGRTGSPDSSLRLKLGPN